MYPTHHDPSPVMYSGIVLLAYAALASASALTTAISPNERLCFFADVDKVGEKIGVRVHLPAPCIILTSLCSSSTLPSSPAEPLTLTLP